MIDLLAIVGVFIFVIYLSYKIDELHHELKKLENKCDDLKFEYESLKFRY